ncbi:uncharacterized protein PHACADRAFT_256753 [Phanerochaete carnosa HHB-10118-sp]|uniref:Anaphase-promoting complex subunit 4-like WD40 domain-containing protein n=1 Tax=Phanerochaete carnosa (strain HHB-10118-sp) TaxID=650164 RepID=K5V075_PHACS|nr:uncharacterized protein PHACADRAFT_256753 [Phanerochaete carnosa HHB-10118-sp]EKM55846.1 hypothetical protein PHACADRAFT_256753 [Phanerochaete carnosa HHB-10118-sp]
MHRQGRNYSAIPSGPSLAKIRRDQCVFLKRHKLRERLATLSRTIVAMTDGHGIMDEELDVIADGHSLSGEGEGPDGPDPLDILLEYMLETSHAEIVVASDDDVESIVGDNRVVDFASYLCQVQPPVEVNGRVGWLCTEYVISHERDRSFTCPTITRLDVEEWPNLTLAHAGRLEHGHVFISPPEAEARPLKSQQLILADSQDLLRSFACFAWSSDSKLLALSFFRSDVLLWRLSDGLLLQRLHDDQGHKNCVRSLAFSPNHDTLASGCINGTVVIWDIRSGRALLRLKAHDSTVRAIAYAPHGSLLATSYKDNSVGVWDISTGARLHTLRLNSCAHELAFSPDDSRLHIASERSCLIYDARTYANIATLQHEGAGDLDWSFSRQGDRIATISHEGQMKVWCAVTGEELLVVNHPRTLSCPVVFSPDGTEVLVACVADEMAIVYDSRTGRLRRNFKLSYTVKFAAYSPGGDYVVFGDDSGCPNVYDAKSGSFLAKFERFRDNMAELQARFLPDNQTLLVNFFNGPPHLCNIQDVMRMR